MPMMRRNTAVPRLILASADPDSISESGSSTSVPPPQPRTPSSASQVARRAGAHVAVEEVMVEGSGSSVVAGTALTRYLHQYGRIPLTRSAAIPDVDVDLNAVALPGASRRPPRHVYRPLICAYCNCAFCFGEDEVPSIIDLGPGYVYPAPPVPITLNLLTQPAVWPLDRADPWAPGGRPEYLLVCSNEQHFRATMGMLQQQQPGGAPSLTWRCTLLCLRVLPVVVGSEGSDSPDLLACPAPPMEPWRYAGAYWNYVRPGDENMVQLKLHDDDPLKLTLGRP